MAHTTVYSGSPMNVGQQVLMLTERNSNLVGMAGEKASPAVASVDIAARAEGTRKRARGVEPGSFLSLMISSRHQESGKGFSDLEATSQAFTFLLAG